MHTPEPSVQLSIPTAHGEFIAIYTVAGLAKLKFPSRSLRPAITHYAEVSPQVRRWYQITVRALEHVLAGAAAGRLPPLDFSAGTNFQRAVWSALLEIRPGHTLTYGAIARAIGRPNAVRAVGGACGANPIPVLVPCHRVLAANKKLGGFSGGLEWKRRLLEREGVKPNS